MHVIMSRDVLSGVRHRLATALPKIKKSHIAEALAAGFGVNSNIALLARLDDYADMRPLIRPLEAQAVAERLRSFGYEVPYNVEAVVDDALSVAPSRAYTERAKGTDISSRLDKRWTKLQPHDICYMAQAAFLFVTDNRPDPERFIGEGAHDGIGQLDGRLLTIWSAMRDLDRSMTDFLTDWMLSGRHNVDENLGVRSTWGQPIFVLFKSRIIRLMGGVTMAWDNKNMPEVSDIRHPDRRVRRPIALTMSKVIDGKEFGIMSADVEAHGPYAALGLLAMGLWLSGHEVGQIEQEAATIMASPDISAAIQDRFPGSSMEAIDYLAQMRVVVLPALLEATYISASDVDIAQSILKRLKAGKHTVGKMPAPAGGYQATTAQVQKMMADFLKAVTRSDPDWLMIDFEGNETNHHMLNHLIQVAAQAGIGIFSVRAPAGVDNAIESAIRGIRKGYGKDTDGSDRAETAVYRV